MSDFENIFFDFYLIFCNFRLLAAGFFVVVEYFNPHIWSVARSKPSEAIPGCQMACNSKMKQDKFQKWSKINFFIEVKIKRYNFDFSFTSFLLLNSSWFFSYSLYSYEHLLHIILYLIKYFIICNVNLVIIIHCLKITGPKSRWQTGVSRN